jgi:hypothetical protein
MRKILFIGKSGSGKTVAAGKLASAGSLPTFVLNDRVEKKDDDRQFFPVDWSEVSDLSNAQLIVEDLISCDPSQISCLQKICNFSAHHSKLPLVILIAHSITKNNIFCLLQYLTHVCFMKSRSTVRSLSHILHHYQFAKEERDRMIADFLADRGKWGYWTLDVEEGSFKRDKGGDVQDLQVDSLGDYMRTAREYLGLFCPERDKALAIFRYILRKIPLQSLSASDLTLNLREKSSKQPRRLSLIDYLHSVTTDEQPSEDVKLLHMYISKYVSIPDCFFTNSWLKSGGGGRRDSGKYVKKFKLINRQNSDNNN